MAKESGPAAIVAWAKAFAEAGLVENPNTVTRIELVVEAGRGATMTVHHLVGDAPLDRLRDTVLNQFVWYGMKPEPAETPEADQNG